MIITHFTYLIVATFLGAIPLVSTAFAEGEIEVQFVSFPKMIDATPIELLVGEGRTELVEMPTNSVSAVYKLTAMSKWVVGKTIVDKEGKKSFEVYGQAPAINSPKQLILAIRKGKSDADGLELIPMDYQSSNFGGGRYFLMNAASVEIAGKIGTGNFSLKPGTHTLISPQPTKVSNGRKYAFAQIFYKNGKEIQPFFSSTWSFNDKARSMVFFYHDPDTRHLRLHSIRNHVN